MYKYLKNFLLIFNKIMVGIIPILITIFIWIYAYEISANNFNELINFKLKKLYFDISSEYVYDQIFLCFELLSIGFIASLILSCFKISKKITFVHTFIFGLILSLFLFSFIFINVSEKFTSYATKSLNKKEKINCLLNDDCNKIYKTISKSEEKYLLVSFYDLSNICATESQVSQCIHKHLYLQYKTSYESK